MSHRRSRPKEPGIAVARFVVGFTQERCRLVVVGRVCVMQFSKNPTASGNLAVGIGKMKPTENENCWKIRRPLGVHQIPPALGHMTYGPSQRHPTWMLSQHRVLRTVVSEFGYYIGKRHIIRRILAQATRESDDGHIRGVCV